jgi:hypothetical protein
MEKSTTADDRDIPELTKVITARRDIVKLCAVEIAIYLKNLLGTRAAAEYLKKQQVDLEVALRVLLHPSQRRNGG